MSTAGSWNGLSFGTGAATGFYVGGVEGLWDISDVRNDDLPKAVGAGSFVGSQRQGTRRIVLTLHIIAASSAAYETLVQSLITATNDVTTVRTLTLMGTKTVQARVSRRIIPIDATKVQRTGTATIEFICADPTVS